MKSIALLLSLSSLGLGSLQAAQVDTLQIESRFLKKKTQAVVITPEAARKKSGKRFPTVYLLHGYSGSFRNWIQKVPALRSAADQYGVIIICPDGSYDCTYIDSPLDSTHQYDSHITFELVAYIDSHYPTDNDRKKRAITGLSLGGHGALTLAWRHSDVFGAAGSMSGAVNLDKLKKYKGLYPILGDTLQQPSNWKTYSFIHMIDRTPAAPLAILFDCGKDDFLIEPNRNLHEKMKRMNIAHTYTEGPGAHTWVYWEQAVAHHLLFFHQYFQSQNQTQR